MLSWGDGTESVVLLGMLDVEAGGGREIPRFKLVFGTIQGELSSIHTTRSGWEVAAQANGSSSPLTASSTPQDQSLFYS
jgi:hypothetical protein